MRWILCIWLCWQLIVLISSLQMSPSPEFNIDPSTHIEADLPKKSVLTVVAHSGDLPTRDLRSSNLKQLRDEGISCRIPNNDLLSLPNCTRYIRNPPLKTN